MNKKYPKVSIVTPSYNQAQFLEETIKSVLQQDYPNIEYIIIDGLSVDRSVDIIRKYEDQLAYWVSEQDRGQCHAINKGFARAQGVIIAWLNSDDLYRPGAIRAVVKSFSDHPDAVAVIGGCVLVDAERKGFSYKKPVDLNPQRLLCGGGIPGQPAVFFRRELSEKVGGLREDLHYVLDWEYWLRVGMHYSQDQVVLLDRIIAEIRIWLGNKTSNGYTIRTKDRAGSQQLNIDERFKVLKDIFSKQQLRKELRKLESTAYSRAYWRKAKYEHRDGLSSAARRNFIKAYQMAPNAYSLVELFLSVAGTYLGFTTIEHIRNVRRIISSIGSKDRSEIKRHSSPY